MITERLQENASLFVAGAMPAEEHRAFERELLGSVELQELVHDLQRTLGLVASVQTTALPPGLKFKVLTRIEQQASFSRPRATAKTAPVSPGFLFHAAADSRGWKELPVKGAFIKLLSLERERGYAVLLGRLDAGVRYPAHRHMGSEELYILTGDLHIGDRALGPGDFHHSDPGTAHDVNHSVEGCTLLAVLPADHELVALAMA